MMNKTKIGMAFFCITAFAMGVAAQTAVTTSSPTTAGYVPLFQTGSTITNSVITQSGGNVGIGNGLTVNSTAAGQITEAVRGSSSGDANMVIQQGNGNGVAFWLTATVSSLGLGGTGGTEPFKGVINILANGTVGIGTSAPGALLEVDGNVKLTSGSGASITFQDGTVQSTAYTGTTCGGDYAESVDVMGSRTNYEPGDLLVIDPSDPGRFLKSAEPYSMLVAGIYSTKPGTVGRRETTYAKTNTTEVPMAMMGIVPTKVSAENGPIKIGDLLVTSSTLGYAMRGKDRNKLTGAVVGKALGSLNAGTGVIEVLVTLQ